MAANLAIRNSAKALIVRDGAVLLQVCQFPDREIVHLLPGGTQEFGESLDATVRREVLEETGLRVTVGELLWVREFIGRNRGPDEADADHSLMLIFRCTPEEGAVLAPPTVPDTEQIDVRWVPLADLPTITLWPEVIHRMLIAWRGDAAWPQTGYLGDRL